MKFLRTCHTFLKGNRLLLFSSLLAQFLMGASSVFTTFLLKVVVDTIEGEASLAKAAFLERAVISLLTYGKGDAYLLENMGLLLPSAIIVSGVISVLLTSLRMSLRTYLSTRLGTSMQYQLFTHLIALPYPFFKENKPGDLIQICTRDTDVLRRFLVGDVSGFFWTFWMVCFCFGILLSISWKMALVSMGLFPLMFVYSFFLIKKVRNKYRLTDESEAKMTDKIAENLSSIRLVKAFHNESYEIASFERRLEDYQKKFTSWRKLSSFFFSSSDIFIFGSKLLALSFGIYLCYTGEINAATLILAILFVNMSVWPLRDAATSFSNMGQYIASAERLDRILLAKEEDLKMGLEAPSRQDITLSHLSFHYPDSKTLVLKDLSFTIPYGKSLAIMGKTGSGKSTLVFLLTRLYDYTEGSIEIGGIELKDISKSSLRKLIKPILQEPFLFSKTIEENVLMGRGEATHEEVMEACALADIEKTIKESLDGYDTIIGEKGTTLSGGQRQRLAIARGALSKASFLIFDDSLSAVDAKTDLTIRENLKKLSSSITPIIITNRISTAKDCDQIIVLEDGKISEKGTHEELLRKEGLYRRIAYIQEKMSEESL